MELIPLLIDSLDATPTDASPHEVAAAAVVLVQQLMAVVESNKTGGANHGQPGDAYSKGTV